MYQQQVAPVGSVWLSALLAALPLLVLFVLLGGLKLKAWMASVIGLALALAVALVVYRMPADQAGLSALEGAAFGLFPAMWIVVNAIWIHNMTVKSGAFDVIKRSFVAVSTDQRIQGLIIAFCFGAVLEALAGFGAPVAICSVLLVAIGLSPLKAATAALVANTAPVAYGAVALPIITLSAVSGLPIRDLSQMTGRQVPLLAIVVPFLLLVILDGRRGLREVWPVAMVGGLSFACTQFLMANFGPVELADIAAGLVATLAILGFLIVVPKWRTSGQAPADTVDDSGGSAATPAGPGTSRAGSTMLAQELDARQDTASQRLRAFSPYIIIIALFSTISIPPVKDVLNKTTMMIKWPGLHVTSADGKPLTLATYKFDWLINGGTVLLIAGILTALLLNLSLPVAARTYGATLVQVRFAAVTVASVLAMAYVMNASGQTVTMGVFLAGAGAWFAVLSPILGWFGTAVTGSDTSSNSLFGVLQVTAAHQTGMSDVLLASANTSGGVLGKMISPQNLAVGAAAVGLSGREGELFRKVLWATAILLPMMCLIAWLQSTPVLDWMVP
ncbi:L-lactate permease [Mycobacterium sp. URHB0021]